MLPVANSDSFWSRNIEIEVDPPMETLGISSEESTLTVTDFADVFPKKFRTCKVNTNVPTASLELGMGMIDAVFEEYDNRYVSRPPAPGPATDHETEAHGRPPEPEVCVGFREIGEQDATVPPGLTERDITGTIGFSGANTWVLCEGEKRKPAHDVLSIHTARNMSAFKNTYSPLSIFGPAVEYEREAVTRDGLVHTQVSDDAPS